MSDASPSSSGLLVVISGPSGVGKTTIVKAARERLNAVFSVSATTRTRTDQETDGEDYFFRTQDEFKGMIARNEFLEYACVFGRDSYGTPRHPVDEAMSRGDLVILEIDVQGGIQVRASMPGALLIFIKPPRNEVLLERLRGRGRDDEAAIQRRYQEATREIAKAESSNVYDVFVINDELALAINETCSVIEQRRFDAVS